MDNDSRPREGRTYPIHGALSKHLESELCGAFVGRILGLVRGDVGRGVGILHGIIPGVSSGHTAFRAGIQVARGA